MLTKGRPWKALICTKSRSALETTLFPLFPLLPVETILRVCQVDASPPFSFQTPRAHVLDIPASGKFSFSFGEGKAGLIGGFPLAPLPSTCLVHHTTRHWLGFDFYDACSTVSSHKCYYVRFTFFVYCWHSESCASWHNTLMIKVPYFTPSEPVIYTYTRYCETCLT